MGIKKKPRKKYTFKISMEKLRAIRSVAGTKGGKTTGKTKRRSPEVVRAAVKARWKNYRAAKRALSSGKPAFVIR